MSRAATILSLVLLSACAVDGPAHRRAVNTRERIGPYSEALLTEELVFLSGQLGIDRTTGKLAAPFTQLTNMVLSHASEDGADIEVKGGASSKSIVDSFKSMLAKPKKAA